MDAGDYVAKLYEFNRQYFAPVVTPTPPPVVTPPVSTRTQRADFEAAKSMPGFIRAFSLRVQSDLGTKDYAYAGKGFGWGAGNEANPEIDARGLHFVIRPHSNANAAGSWGCKLADDDSILIGEGESLYLRWMQRWSAGMRAIVAQNVGTKFLDIGTGGQADQDLNTTNSNTKVVMQTHGGWMAPILYTYPNMGLEERIAGGADYQFQNKVDGCLYTNNGAGCWQMPTDEDVCFQLGIDVLDRVDDSHVHSRIRLWATKGGVTKLLHDWNPNTPGYVPQFWPKGEKQGRINVFPYMTGKDPSKDHPEGHVWVWFLAVAREKMPDPVSTEQSPEPVREWETLGYDFDTVTLAAQSKCRYGAGDTWVNLELAAGQVLVLPATFGIADPLPGVRKQLDRWTGSAPIADGTPPVPVTPAHPTPPVVIVPSGDLPAWRRGAKLGEWSAIPGTENLSGVIPPEWAGTINAWGGFAQTRNGFVSAANSGHGEPWNPVIGIDILTDAPKWAMLKASSDPSAYNFAKRYADDAPCSRHGYSTGQIIEAEHAHDGVERVALCGAYATYATGHNEVPGAYMGGPEMEAFRLDTKQWEPLGTLPQLPVWFDLPSICRDYRDGRIYYAAGYTYARYTPQTNSWDVPGGRPGYSDTGLLSWDYLPSLVDAKRNRLVGLIDGRPYNQAAGMRLQRIDLATNAVDVVNVTGLPNLNTGACMVHVEDTDRYWLIDLGIVHEIDPDTGVATRLADAPVPVASTENRCAWFKKLGAVVYLPSYSSPLVFWPTR